MGWDEGGIVGGERMDREGEEDRARRQQLQRQCRSLPYFRRWFARRSFVNYVALMMPPGRPRQEDAKGHGSQRRHDESPKLANAGALCALFQMVADRLVEPGSREGIDKEVHRVVEVDWFQTCEQRTNAVAIALRTANKRRSQSIPHSERRPNQDRFRNCNRSANSLERISSLRINGVIGRMRRRGDLSARADRGARVRTRSANKYQSRSRRELGRPDLLPRN